MSGYSAEVGIIDGEWYRDHAASGWRSRAWLGDLWELIAYDDGRWEVRGPPIGYALAEGKLLDGDAAKARAIAVQKVMSHGTPVSEKESTMSMTQITLDKLREEWTAPLKARIAVLESEADSEQKIYRCSCCGRIGSVADIRHGTMCDPYGRWYAEVAAASGEASADSDEEEAWLAYCEIHRTGGGPQGDAQRHAFAFACSVSADRQRWKRGEWGRCKYLFKNVTNGFGITRCALDVDHKELHERVCGEETVSGMCDKPAGDCPTSVRDTSLSDGLGAPRASKAFYQSAEGEPKTDADGDVLVWRARPDCGDAWLYDADLQNLASLIADGTEGGMAYELEAVEMTKEEWATVPDDFPGW